MSSPREVSQLTVRLGADLTHLLSGFARATQRLQKFSDDVSKIGDRLQGLGGSLSVRVTAPLMAMATAATLATADFETAMVGVAKTVDAPAESIDTLGRYFQALSERIPVAANELAGIAEEAGQLGIALQNIPSFTEVIAGLRVATNLGGEAATTLARLANVMGTSQTEFSRMGSTIVALGNTLATTEAEIAEMSLRIAGAGRQVGMTEAQVLAFAGALSSVGIEADAGGSAISRTMIEIASAVEGGGAKLEAFADVAGVSATEFARLFQTDAAAAIQAFIAGLGTLEDRGKSTFAVLDELGLSEIRVRDMLLRSSLASDVLARALETSAEAWEENTALADEAGHFYDRLAARFQILRNRVVNITSEFGDALRPAIDRVVEAAHRMLNVARGLVQAFASLSEQTRVQIATWAAIAAAIGPAVAAAGALAKAFSFVLSALNPVTVAIAAIATAVIAIRNNWLGMGDAAGRAWQTILDVGTRVIQTLHAAFRPWANLLIASLHSVGQIAVLVFNEYLREPFVRAFRTMRDWARPVLSAIASGLEMLGRLASGVAEKIREAFSDAAEGAEEEGATIGQRIAAAIVDNFGRDYVGAFTQVVLKGVDRARQFVVKAIEKLRSMSLGGAAVADLEQAEVALAGIGEGVGEVGSGVDRTTKQMSHLANAAENIASAFADSLGGAINGVQQALRSFINYAIRELVSLAARFMVFKLAMGIAGGPAGLAGTFGDSFLGFKIPGRAMGGPVTAGRPYLVGERGPEIVVPRESGTVVPNHALQQAITLRLDTASLPPYPARMSPAELAVDDWWRRAFSALTRDYADRGGR